MDDKPKAAERTLLSVIICTYDRHDLLLRTLAGLGEVEGIDACEVIVVDNTDCSESRRETRLACAGRFPSVRFIESDPPGLSRARNLGLAHAKADLVAYLDDDAAPGPGWAVELIAAFRDQRTVFAGGPIDPNWEIPPPAWLPEEIYGAFTVLDLGNEDRVLRDSEFIYGANMAFRADALRRIGGFNESLGRVKTNLHGEEDIAVQRILLSSGQGRYAARARVSHFIPRERVNWNWLVRRFAWQGFSEFSQDGALQDHHRQAIEGLDGNEHAARFYSGLLQMPSSKDDARARLNVIRAVFGSILYGKQNLASIKSPGLEERPAGRAIPAGAPKATSGLRSHAVSRSRPTFVEFGQAHSYLMKSFGDIGSCEFINPPFNAYHDGHAAAKALRDIRARLRPGGLRPFFLTLDCFLFDREAVLGMECLPAAGILHRIHVGREVANNLRRLGATTRIACFSSAVADWAEQTTGVACTVLPHPPLFFKNVPARSVAARRAGKARRRTDGKWIVSLLGELRPGKGFEDVILALGKCAPIRSNIVLTLGGGGSRRHVEELTALARSVSLETDLHVRTQQNGDFRGIDDVAFGKLIDQSDIMLFPYHGPEAKSISGHFVDSVFAGCRLLVSDVCAMAQLTERYQLGRTFAPQDASSLCAMLEQELRKGPPSETEDQLVNAFQDSHSAEACVGMIRELIRP